MKRVIASLIAGCLLTWIMYLIANVGWQGPNTVIFIITLPVQLVVKLITKHSQTADHLFYVLMVCVNAFVVYLVLYAAGKFRKPKK